MSLLRPYVSKSSIETYNSCGIKFYYNYTLGLKDPPRIKTILGTATHTVAEILAGIKKEIQEGKTEGVFKSEVGDIQWDEISFSFPSVLTEKEVSVINKSRINKQIYKSDCFIKSGAIRNGRDFINRLIEKTWNYYVNSTQKEIEFWNQEWKNSDKTTLINYVWLLLENIDITKIWVVDIEKEFDLPIEHEDCKLPNNEYIRVKGFIDLVFKRHKDDDVIQFVDYKSGERKDFNSGEEKTLNDLSEDLQLTLYNKLMKILYPDYKYVIGSILFIRDGGLFTPNFAENSDSIITQTIHEHIQELKNCVEPKILSEQRDDFRCKYLCGASKRKTFHKEHCDCEIIKNSIREVGLEQTTEIFRV